MVTEAAIGGQFANFQLAVSPVPKRVRCPVAPADCHNEWVAPGIVPYLVGLGSLLVLIVPMLNSMGVTLRTAFSFGGMQPTFETAILSLIFVMSFLLGVFRKHEHEWFCILDSISFPGLIIYGLKESGVILGGQ
jgi:hypothetical protein